MHRHDEREATSRDGPCGSTRPRTVRLGPAARAPAAPGRPSAIASARRRRLPWPGRRTSAFASPPDFGPGSFDDAAARQARHRQPPRTSAGASAASTDLRRAVRPPTSILPPPPHRAMTSWRCSTACAWPTPTAGSRTATAPEVRGLDRGAGALHSARSSIALPGVDAIRRRLRELFSIGTVAPPSVRARPLLLRAARRGRRSSPVLYVRDGLHGADRVLLDPASRRRRTAPRPSTGTTRAPTGASSPTASPRAGARRACSACATWRADAISRT